MHENDTVLTALLQGSANSVLEQISGMRVERWLPMELPQVNATRIDLLGETTGGQLLHIELQSTREPLMLVRMGEYLFRGVRLHGRVPKQIVLYVGEGEPRMTTNLGDIRDLDTERLLASPWVSDNVIAILAKLSDRREAVRRVLRRISTGERRCAAWRLGSFRFWRGCEG